MRIFWALFIFSAVVFDVVLGLRLSDVLDQKEQSRQIAKVKSGIGVSGDDANSNPLALR